MDLGDGNSSSTEENSSAEDECSSDKEIENELYSVLHYHDFGNGIPDEISAKYNVHFGENNEVTISLKTHYLDSNVESDQPFQKVCDSITSQNDNNKRTSRKTNEPYQEKCLENYDGGSIRSKRVKNNNIPLIYISDSDSEDDVILNTEPVQGVITISDSDSEAGGTSPPAGNWEDIDSPTTWTPEMKKYYNKPCKHLKYFDDVSVRRKLRAVSNDWFVAHTDLLPGYKRKPKCPLCKLNGHLYSECSQRRRNCHMCGNPGHTEARCPSSMCLNCGTRSNVFRAVCEKCMHDSRAFCSMCKTKGHSSYLCTDAWRRFHHTTGPGEIKNDTKQSMKQGRIFCCHCAQEGHIYENCTELFKSIHSNQSAQYSRKQDVEVHKNGIRIFIPAGLNLRNRKFRQIFDDFQAKGLSIKIIKSNDMMSLLKVTGASKKVAFAFRKSLYSTTELKKWKARQFGEKKKPFWRNKDRKRNFDHVQFV